MLSAGIRLLSARDRLSRVALLSKVPEGCIRSVWPAMPTTQTPARVDTSVPVCAGDVVVSPCWHLNTKRVRGSTLKSVMFRLARARRALEDSGGSGMCCANHHNANSFADARMCICFRRLTATQARALPLPASALPRASVPETSRALVFRLAGACSTESFAQTLCGCLSHIPFAVWKQKLVNPAHN